MFCWIGIEVAFIDFQSCCIGEEQIDALHCPYDIYIETIIQTFSIIYWIVTTTTAPLLLPIGSPLMLVKSRYFGFFSSLALRAAISSNLIASRTLHSWVLIFTLLFRSLSCKKVQKIKCKCFWNIFYFRRKEEGKLQPTSSTKF